ncbi:glycoside hydrolase family 32 protein [Jeotgalibacillus sp. JSM ZJ347]|uniref:glycoside hydrolase family 32 protein n=1 Tax=Jeotgalibacillus sp. JSM ZJ347 TaxID=3342117 RepID=UPI0035A91F69
MEKEIQIAEASIQEKEHEARGHHWYPRIHVAPRVYWMNDPNGFSYFNGEYHLFYQHHPFSPEWGPMHWGHVVSRDLVIWEHLPVALAPSLSDDADGCFSGSAIEVDGKLIAMYTGNVWTGPDHDTDLKQVQMVAESNDGIHFTKWEKPVISEAPEGDVHPFHFRDPKVWKREGTYYCVLGSRTKDHIGQVLLYKSDDLISWDFVAVSAKKEGNGGFMWECPDFFHLGEKDVLVMSPQGVKPEGNKFHNLHQAVYVLGELDYETGQFTHGEFHMLDAGFDFYAPQTLEDQEGRRVMIGWMDMWESEMPTQAHGFCGAMTIPRVLVPDGERLLVQPLPELAELRKEAVYVENETISAKQTFDSVSGTSLEMKLEVNVKDADAFNVNFRCGNVEKTVLSWSREESAITLDRSASGAGVTGMRSVEVKEQDRLTLHLFLDQSSAEIFINHGEAVMTARIYPEETSDGIEFEVEGEAVIERLWKWDLNSAFSSKGGI